MTVGLYLPSNSDFKNLSLDHHQRFGRRLARYLLPSTIDELLLGGGDKQTQYSWEPKVPPAKLAPQK